MAEDEQSFEAWMRALREHAKRQWPEAGEDDLGPERWRGYFDQGFTPEQALAEEQGFGSEA
jgi:hypothetical protein